MIWTPDRFIFERDTFAFANELIWEYRIDPVTGATATFRNRPPPTYAHRCFVLVRSARQFFLHARFEPNTPPLPAEDYRQRVRRVVDRNPRRAGPASDRVGFPGFPGLREFSRAHTTLLQAECGAAWQSYFLRSHWRMVLPFSRRHQERTVPRLIEAIGRRPPAIVHVVRFPALTINHGLALFAAASTNAEVRFDAYDPNIPAHPTVLTYSRADRTFFLPRNHYWAGGRVDVFHIYRSWLC